MGATQVHSAPPCAICGKAMELAHIEPKVASFAELHIFRCSACGDVRSIEQKTDPCNPIAVRPSFFD